MLALLYLASFYLWHVSLFKKCMAYNGHVLNVQFLTFTSVLFLTILVYWKREGNIEKTKFMWVMPCLVSSFNLSLLMPSYLYFPAVSMTWWMNSKLIRLYYYYYNIFKQNCHNFIDNDAVLKQVKIWVHKQQQQQKHCSNVTLKKYEFIFYIHIFLSLFYTFRAF